MTATHPVDLARVGRTHRGEQHGVARRTVVRQVAGVKVEALGGPAANHGAANGHL